MLLLPADFMCYFRPLVGPGLLACWVTCVCHLAELLCSSCASQGLVQIFISEAAEVNVPLQTGELLHSSLSTVHISGCSNTLLLCRGICTLQCIAACELEKANFWILGMCNAMFVQLFGKHRTKESHSAYIGTYTYDY